MAQCGGAVSVMARENGMAGVKKQHGVK